MFLIMENNYRTTARLQDLLSRAKTLGVYYLSGPLHCVRPIPSISVVALGCGKNNPTKMALCGYFW